MPTNLARPESATSTHPLTVEGEVVEDPWVREAEEGPVTTILIDTGRGVVKAELRGDDAIRAAGVVGEQDRVQATGRMLDRRRLMVARLVRLRDR